jgi:hypothetical protein
MKSLEQKHAKLEDKCRAVIWKFTGIAMCNRTLNFLLMKACEPMIQLCCEVNQTKTSSKFISTDFIPSFNNSW